MAGNYQVSFEINNLAEGIYFYTLELQVKVEVIQKQQDILLIK